MPNIHKDPRFPKGVWYCSYYRADGKRAFRSTKTKNKAVATAICHSLAEAERCAREGTLTQNRATELINETLRRSGQQPIVSLTLGNWLKEAMESRTEVSRGSRTKYEFACRRFLEVLGPGSENRLLETIVESDIRKFIAVLKSEGRAPATINRIIRGLSFFFGRAVKLGKLKFSPFAGVEAQKDTDKMEHATFTPEQVARLVANTRGSEWEGVILMAYTSGTRLRDCVNLTWTEVQLQTGVLDFRQRKTGDRNVVGIHPDFESWLLQHVSDDPKGKVFPDLLRREKGLSNEFNDIVDRCKIDAGKLRSSKGASGKNRRNLTFHSLRHTAASTIFNSAAVKETVRRVTGHAGNAVDQYLHLDLESIKSATALIPRLPLE